MADHGGYRAPANPAATSGPGALSKRTDGGPGQPVSQMTGLPYGEAQKYQALQQSAPMADASDAGPDIVPLTAPTQQPNQPVTAGSPLGPGPGPEAMAMPTGRLTDMLARLLGNDISGDLEQLYLSAEAQGL